MKKAEHRLPTRAVQKCDRAFTAAYGTATGESGPSLVFFITLIVGSRPACPPQCKSRLPHFSAHFTLESRTTAPNACALRFACDIVFEEDYLWI